MGGDSKSEWTEAHGTMRPPDRCTAAGPAPLTRTQRDLLRILCEMTEADGICPSLSELAEEMDLRSRGAIHRTMLALEQRGWVRRLPFHARAIQILYRPVMPDFDLIFVQEPGP